MASGLRLKDLTEYASVLPYASEMFGVYQPMLGWRSKRQLRRVEDSPLRRQLVTELGRHFRGRLDLDFNADNQFVGGRIDIGVEAPSVGRGLAGGVLTQVVASELLERGAMPVSDEWMEHLDEGRLEEHLNDSVLRAHMAAHQERFTAVAHSPHFDEEALKATTRRIVERESVTAAVLSSLARAGAHDALAQVFGGGHAATVAEILEGIADAADPWATIDPDTAARMASVSPLGIVHLFHQYFFELDTFLGSPVGHVWLSPGSMVELIEISTRRSLVEKTIEIATQRIQREERALTEQNDISEAVKQDNRQDTKLGFSTTVTQSWGSGSVTGTTSLDLATTQQTAREQMHRRSRQQSEKLSTEMRQDFRSTFKTVTETVDTSSKRYVLNNTTSDLVNFELRRKMRQVGVQVQDVGTYLCWQTFVDDPGRDLAIPELIHIAKPADLVVVPDPQLVPMPAETVPLAFSGEAVWNFPDNSRQHGEDHPEVQGRLVPLATLDIAGVPADYEVAVNVADPFIPIDKQVVSADDDESWNANGWAFLGMLSPDGKRVTVGVVTDAKPGGLAWDDRITFKVSGSVTCRLTSAKRAAVNNANAALEGEKLAATDENKRRHEQALMDAVRERVTLASKITHRRFEDLREEERTIVYRRLIATLLTERFYKSRKVGEVAPDEIGHVLSEVLNAIFDIDKMLYFVAPEWWRPRHEVARMRLGDQTVPEAIGGNLVRWSEGTLKPPYHITDESDPAPLGASLGWLIQLDGDDLRNAFLNAPWVKAVIPVRPGKEQAALSWLQGAGAEGTEGLDDDYVADQAELDRIRAELLAADPSDPVAGHPKVTISDALRQLCREVAAKHEASLVVGRHPEGELDDDNRVSATPIDTVYEHGFYPLVGGFKAVTQQPFEVFDQWIEVVPTDQVVPVAVTYDPRTGRQLPPLGDG